MKTPGQVSSPGCKEVQRSINQVSENATDSEHGEGSADTTEAENGKRLDCFEISFPVYWGDR